MKSAMVPAQVTTVEDKIAGNLSLQQLLMLTSPIFIGAAIFVLFPPMIHLTALKLTVSSIIFIVFASMAIRIKGRLLVEWAVVIARYNVRPKYYVFNKNDNYLRASAQTVVIEEKGQEVAKKPRIMTHHLPKLSVPELVRIEGAIADPRANFNVMTRKGKLNVNITEIK
ncbi:PrgI family protein [Candidatus Saccharibacteria bacterium]|nr:PrgI family protein [Candidatus Saccharibacteria bacterium]